MAAISSESNTISNYPVDLLFDLDEALTMTTADSGLQIKKIAAPKDMPTATVTSTIHHHHHHHHDLCTVCIESLGLGDQGSEQQEVPCGHVYHATCIASWLSRHNSCPLCRCKISTQTD